MRLDHEFTVPAPPAQVWQAVTDPEAVAPCMPGATLTKVDGDTFTGTVKVKLGPIALTYKGSGEFLEKDEAARKIVIKASGKDQRGAGTAAATVTVTLTEEGGGTKGTVGTDLNVTGRPAQFGRGMITEVGGKILDQFATNLANKLGGGEADAGSGAASAGSGAEGASGQSTPSAPEAAKPAAADKVAETASVAQSAPSAKPKLESVKPAEPQQEAEAIDLFDLAGTSVAKRIAPVLAGVAVLLGIIAVVRALRK